MTDLDRAIAAFRDGMKAVNPHTLANEDAELYERGVNLLATLDAARGQAVAWVDEFGNAYPLSAYSGKGDWQDDYKRHWRRAYAAPPAAAVPEVNYFDAQRIADEYKLPFNAFCAAHRAMLAAAAKENTNG